MRISSILFHTLVAGIFLFSIYARFAWLGTIPGMNGDEAFMAVKAQLVSLEFPYFFTPTGNLLSIPSFVLQYITHVLFPENSFFLLRLPSAIAGSLVAVAAYAFLRQPLDRSIAIMSALLMATLPMHIVYSRFAWEPSLTPLIVLLCIAAALRGRLVLTLVAFFFSMNIHPTNIFLAPMLLALLFVARGNTLRMHLPRQAALVYVMLPVITFMGIMLVLRISHIDYWNVIQQATSWQRLSSAPTQWMPYSRLLGEFFTGITIYKYVIGVVDPAQFLWHIILWFFIIIPILVVGICMELRKGISSLVTFACGFCVSTILFFLISGIDAISPHTERYALWMTVPFCILFAMASARVCNGLRVKSAYSILTICLPLLLLWSFQQNFIAKFIEINSLSHPTFLTGNHEPKANVMEYIAMHADAPGETIIFTEDWWIYWPMKYLSLNITPHPVITILGIPWSRTYPRDFIPTQESFRNAYFIGWSNGSFSTNSAYRE